jgi:Leu/Phe-tRNA-protein transferase
MIIPLSWKPELHPAQNRTPRLISIGLDVPTQRVTQHLAKFGAYEIPRGEYLEKLERAVEVERKFLE